MAEAPIPTTTQQHQTFDPQAHYDVALKLPITIGNRQFRPGEKIQLRGDVMNAHPGSIASFNKVGG